MRKQLTVLHSANIALSLVLAGCRIRAGGGVSFSIEFLAAAGTELIVFRVRGFPAVCNDMTESRDNQGGLIRNQHGAVCIPKFLPAIRALIMALCAVLRAGGRRFRNQNARMLADQQLSTVPASGLLVHGFADGDMLRQRICHLTIRLSLEGAAVEFDFAKILRIEMNGIFSSVPILRVREGHAVPQDQRSVVDHKLALRLICSAAVPQRKSVCRDRGSLSVHRDGALVISCDISRYSYRCSVFKRNVMVNKEIRSHMDSCAVDGQIAGIIGAIIGRAWSAQIQLSVGGKGTVAFYDKTAVAAGINAVAIGIDRIFPHQHDGELWNSRIDGAQIAIFTATFCNLCICQRKSIGFRIELGRAISACDGQIFAVEARPVDIEAVKNGTAVQNIWCEIITQRFNICVLRAFRHMEAEVCRCRVERASHIRVADFWRRRAFKGYAGEIAASDKRTRADKSDSGGDGNLRQAGAVGKQRAFDAVGNLNLCQRRAAHERTVAGCRDLLKGKRCERPAVLEGIHIHVKAFSALHCHCGELLTVVERPIRNSSNFICGKGFNGAPGKSLRHNIHFVYRNVFQFLVAVKSFSADAYYRIRNIKICVGFRSGICHKVDFARVV